MTSHPITATLRGVKQSKADSGSIQQRQRLWGWIFLAPWLIGFFVFSFFPMLVSLVFSFTDFQIGHDVHWIGLTNWQRLFTDPVTVNSIGITLRFALLFVVVSTIIPVLLGALLTSKLLMGKPVLRILFYMPYMIPTVSAVFVWIQFLNARTGWLNIILHTMGITDSPSWFGDTRLVHIALAMMGLWGMGNAMLTIMISIQGIPTQLHEAAMVDGASPFLRFQHITLPLLSPMIFYNLILSIIGVMQYFVVPYILTADPNNYKYSSEVLNFLNLHLYRTAFRFADMGYACAIAWFMFSIALALTIMLFATSRQWVYYTNETD